MQSPTTFFTGVGFVTPQNSTVTSSTAGGLLYVAFFVIRSMRNVLKRRRELDADQHFRRRVTPAPDVNSGLSGYADYNGNPRIFVGGGPSARTGV